MLEIRYSGGSGNTNPSASLGGAMSSTKVSGDTVAYHSGQSIAGVAVVGGVGNTPDVSASTNSAALALVIQPNAQKLLYFTPFGKTPATVDPESNSVLNLAASGTFELQWIDSWGVQSVVVAVTIGSVPSSDVTARLDVVRPSHGLFDAIPTAENQSPVPNYRCVYVTNVGTTSKTVRAGLGQNPSGSTIECGFDPSGIGGVPSILANEATAPAGVVFNNPSLYDDWPAVTLTQNQFIALWLKRTPVAMRPNAIIGDNFTLILRG